MSARNNTVEYFDQLKLLIQSQKEATATWKRVSALQDKIISNLEVKLKRSNLLIAQLNVLHCVNKNDRAKTITMSHGNKIVFNFKLFYETAQPKLEG